MNKFVIKYSSVLLLSTFLFPSCDTTRVFEENKEIPEYIWKASEKVLFNVPIADTSNPHNIYINVRNADDYPFSNLYLFITTAFPNGKSSKDTLECILADDQGHWLGDGLGDIWDNQIPFKRNVKFPIPGTYTVTIEHAMRTNELRQVMDVGIRIEKQPR